VALKRHGQPNFRRSFTTDNRAYYNRQHVTLLPYTATQQATLQTGELRTGCNLQRALYESIEKKRRWLKWLIKLQLSSLPSAIPTGSGGNPLERGKKLQVNYKYIHYKRIKSLYFILSYHLNLKDLSLQPVQINSVTTLFVWKSKKRDMWRPPENCFPFPVLLRLKPPYTGTG
jgi:hypothetical protein